MNNQSQAIHIKKEILVRIIKAFLSDDFIENSRLIPYQMRPKGMAVPYRCCVYKERAIIKDRVIAGLGFPIEEDDETVSLSAYAKQALEREKISEKNLTVLQAACKGCATNKIYVTNLCQGCLARSCYNACKFGAISFVNGKSIIDEEKCKKCKLCVKECPYNAIVKIGVPCEDSCPVGAIKKDETNFASIDYQKCINCGRCISACPFGAVHERSQIIDVLKAIKSGKKIVAIIAPSIIGQFPGTIYQLKSGMLKAGFSDVYEAALGADITANNEAKEFVERIKEGSPFMTTSCCAGYNQLIKKHLQEITPFVSTTKTPLYYTAQVVKQKMADALTVFITPCAAKRCEAFENPDVDLVMNYEELGALFIAKKIEILDMEDSGYVKESSKQARNFGYSGGVAEAVKKSLPDETLLKPFVVNGLSKENIALLRKCVISKSCEGGSNLIEVMCCEGGCIGGNATLNNQKSAKRQIDNFTKDSSEIQKVE